MTSRHRGAPTSRIQQLNESPLRPRRAFVLYWMIAQRRCGFNPALDHAVALALELDKPLLVFEPLRVGYRWASDRLHRFVLDGMRDNRATLSRTPAAYYPYVEPHPGAGSGLLEALAGRACAVVTDTYPCFFLPAMVAAAASRLDVRLDAVDGNGLLPLSATDRTYPSAYAFRRMLQKRLPAHLGESPRARPLAGSKLDQLSGAPEEILRRWPAAADGLLAGGVDALADLPIDHDVEPSLTGGSRAGTKTLNRFLDHALLRYDEQRNDLDESAASGLSPFLHFGHVGSHQVLNALAHREDWQPQMVSGRTDGKRQGWWQMSTPAQAFLDQLVTWRELGFHDCHHRPDHARYESLPEWARTTLENHASDARSQLYDLEQFARAETHDPLWNAAQVQLLREGTIHNYLRMLWGKKILEWSSSPREALRIMIELNNRYALDGRDPNSYSGIFWTLGRYDRPFGPERPVFGKIRFMSSANTRRKMKVDGYIQRYQKEPA